MEFAFGAVIAAALLTESLPLPSALRFPPPVLLVVLIGLAALPFLATRWRATFLGSLRLVHGRGSDPQVPRERHPRFMKDGLYLMLVVGLFIDPAVRGMELRDWIRRRLRHDDRVERRPRSRWPSSIGGIPLIALKLDWQYVPSLSPDTYLRASTKVFDGS